MRVRLLRDFWVLGEWQLGGHCLDVPDPLGSELLMADVAERVSDLETAALAPSRTAARTKRGKGRKRG